MVAGSAANYVGKPANGRDSLVGLAKGPLMELFRDKCPLLRRPRKITRATGPGIGERECGFADDKVLPGLELKFATGLAAIKDRIGRSRQRCDLELAAFID